MSDKRVLQAAVQSKTHNFQWTSSSALTTKITSHLEVWASSVHSDFVTLIDYLPLDLTFLRFICRRDTLTSPPLNILHLLPAPACRQVYFLVIGGVRLPSDNDGTWGLAENWDDQREIAGGTMVAGWSVCRPITRATFDQRHTRKDINWCRYNERERKWVYKGISTSGLEMSHLLNILSENFCEWSAQSCSYVTVALWI